MLRRRGVGKEAAAVEELGHGRGGRRGGGEGGRRGACVMGAG
jgi:hypothetical protein